MNDWAGSYGRYSSVTVVLFAILFGSCNSHEGQSSSTNQRQSDSSLLVFVDSITKSTRVLRGEDIAIVAVKNSIPDSVVSRVVELYEQETYQSLFRILLEAEPNHEKFVQRSHTSLLSSIAQECSLTPEVVATVVFEYRLLGHMDDSE